jgi:hypothetical protein
MSCKFGHFCVFLSKLSWKKATDNIIIIKHFKVAKNSIEPNKYHLVKAFFDIKIYSCNISLLKYRFF